MQKIKNEYLPDTMRFIYNSAKDCNRDQLFYSATTVMPKGVLIGYVHEARLVTAIHVMSLYNCLSLIQELYSLSEFSDPDMHEKILKYIFSEADINGNIPDRHVYVNATDRTPLMYSVLSNQLEPVNYFLALGANASWIDNSGNSVLDLAKTVTNTDIQNAIEEAL